MSAEWCGTWAGALGLRNHDLGRRRCSAGAGGFLENIVFGYMGLRYEPSGLSIAPSLPPYNVSELTLRGVAFAGGTVRLTVNSTHLTLSRTSGTQLTVPTTTT